MAKNILIGYGNLTDGSVLSSGSWAAGLPLTNLQSREPGLVARSSNALLASTKFEVDLGIERNLKLLALHNHNLSIAAKVRISAGDTPGFSTAVYDTGWQDVWPSLWASEDLEWESDNFWDGKFTTDDITAWSPSTKAFYIESAYARYWRVEFDDTTNASGYVQIERLFMSDKWQPARNFSKGASLGIESRTSVEESEGGAEYFNKRQGARVYTFDMKGLSDDEAYARVLDIQRREDISGEILVVPDPTDQLHTLRRVFLGRLKSLSPIEQIAYNLHSTSFIVKELL